MLPVLNIQLLLLLLLLFLKKSFLTLRQINQKILEATSTAFFTANISLRSNRRNPQLGRQNCIRFITSNNITD